MKSILFLTSSNIKTDAKILRTMKSLNDYFTNCKLIGIGFDDGEEVHVGNYSKTINIVNKILIFDFNKIPYFIKRAINLVEMNFCFLRMLFKINPNVVHVNDYHPLPSILFYKIFKKVLIVYDAHELESGTIGIGRFSSSVIFILEKLVWKRLSLFINPSYSVTNWYLDQLGVISNVTVLNTPENLNIDLEFPENYLRDKFNISNNSKVFIYIGILNLGRGIEIILEAFSDPDILSHCVFLGYGPYAEKIIQEALINNKIHFHEAVEHELVLSIASSADVGLAIIENTCLNSYYCSPNKLFEYAFSNIFVLTSDLPEMRRIIEKYNLGEVVTPDVRSLIKKIKVIENRDNLDLVRINFEELSWEFQSKRLIEAYEEFL